MSARRRIFTPYLFRHLVSQLWKPLSADAKDCSELALNGLLRQAVAASNAKYDEEEVQDNLAIKLARGAGAQCNGCYTVHYVFCNVCSMRMAPWTSTGSHRGL